MLGRHSLSREVILLNYLVFLRRSERTRLSSSWKPHRVGSPCKKKRVVCLASCL